MRFIKRLQSPRTFSSFVLKSPNMTVDGVFVSFCIKHYEMLLLAVSSSDIVRKPKKLLIHVKTKCDIIVVFSDYLNFE